MLKYKTELLLEDRMLFDERNLEELQLSCQSLSEELNANFGYLKYKGKMLFRILRKGP